ncbi:MAG: hypothetical protein AAF636_05380 [Pseudomonadota bacterium]
MPESFNGTVTFSPEGSGASQETGRIDGDTGNIFMGGNGVDGDVVLRGGQGKPRARLDASGQRLELLDRDGNIIGMIGGAGNIRAGTNGEGGDLFLYPESTTNIFNDQAASVRLNANRGDMTLGGSGTGGSVFLTGSNGQVRARMTAGGQRLELLNQNEEIISMIGGGANVRAGTNGEDGNIFLYPAGAGNIFNNGAATVSIDASNGNLTLGDNGTRGTVLLQDANGRTRTRLQAASQRAEFLNPDGDIIAMIGGGANVRAGTHGEAGNMFLYDADAQDIFNNGQATIALNGQTGDIVLRNADCAEEFPLSAAAVAVAGQVVRLAEDGQVTPSTDAYDRRVAGIVAGAGDLRPGLVLGRDENNRHAVPVAMMGRVWCRASAINGAIAVGDPLVSADLEGHAMLATDPGRAIGAVIGKAIDPLETGEDMIRVLVNLQ